MKLSQKIQLLSIVPLMLVMFLVVLVTKSQFEKLSDQTASIFRESLTNSRKQELKNYIALSLSAIEFLSAGKPIERQTIQHDAIELLNHLEFGEDGYFFAYTETGDNIVHPRQPFRVGRNWWELQDQSGRYLIQELIREAQSGGGYVEYLWEKPSSQEQAKKLGYSVLLEPWNNVMLGTGIYIDDIDRDVAAMQGGIDQQIKDSSFVILIIALAAFAVIFISGMLIQLSERKLADAKLQQLTKRILTTQDEERRRLSRELHDGISQLVASVKFSLEMASIKVKAQQDPHHDIHTAQERITQTLQDLRRISRDLHPSILDDHGLSVGIQSLAKSFSERTGIQVEFQEISVRNLLPLEVKTALYRVAQEALTNIERHADATLVNISIKITGSWVVLSIKDNGSGFNVESLRRSKSPTEGIGLRNMHERLAYHKGEFSVSSSRHGTLVEAKIPKSLLRYDQSIEK